MFFFPLPDQFFSFKKRGWHGHGHFCVCVLCGTSAEVVLEHAVLVPEGFDLMSCKEHFFGGT